MTTRVLFDVSRLMSRIERGSPTGVDRVCLAYAEWLSNRPGVQMIPVRGPRPWASRARSGSSAG